jgi:toxin ParE1/3/4
VRVVLTDAARNDLIRIGDRIADDNPIRARSFVRELREKARQIGGMPRGFSLVPRYEHSGIRRRLYGDYLIFYRIERDHIAVIHILHGAQDYGRLLFPEE